MLTKEKKKGKAWNLAKAWLTVGSYRLTKFTLMSAERPGTRVRMGCMAWGRKVLGKTHSQKPQITQRDKGSSVTATETTDCRIRLSKDPGEKRIMIHMFEEIKKRKIWARRRAIKSSSSLEKEQNSIQKCKI